MSQTKVTSYYGLRKNIKSPRKKAINSDLLKNVDTLLEDGSYVEANVKTTKRTTVRNESKVKASQNVISVKEEQEKVVVKLESLTEDTKARDVKRKPVKRVNKSTKSKKTGKSKVASSTSQSTVTSFYGSTTNNSASELQAPIDVVPNVDAPPDLSKITDNLNSEKNSECESQDSCLESKCDKKQLSPKRNLTISIAGSPTKKRLLQSDNHGQHIESSPVKSSDEIPKTLSLTGEEQESVESDTNASIPKDDVSHDKQKKVAQKALSEETKKAIASFKEKLAKVRNYEENPFKVTSVISTSKEKSQTSVLPSIPAYQRYSYLVDPEASSSLILPVKYKLLSEMFRSMDTVVSILNNRKEKITFEKVKEGIQKMLKRNFSKTHLGQIVKVMPSAYHVTLEKCAFKKADDPDYQLIITPASLENEVNNKSGIVNMSPQVLLERKHEFNQRLLDIVKDVHSKFLLRINFPNVSEKSIKRWHPKFPVDSVPDIEAAALPEIPEAKVCTAKDVLNKIVKGSVQSKVVNALKSVAKETSAPNIDIGANVSKPKNPSENKALKGVCADLLAKVRARESAKCLECMTETPNQRKKKAMLERLPKMVQIIWHYFIAERKAAVPVDVAVEKIIHSFNSLLAYDEVKEHLSLITETFPGWLSFIQISKGLYITMDKNKNIHEMLDKLQS